MLSVFLTLVGRISDIFGRRWVFAGGSIVGLVGSIICAVAKDIPTLIGGTTLIGIGAATQVSFPIVVGELLPMRYRFYGNALIFIFAIPGSGFGPAVANAFILYTSVGWRGMVDCSLHLPSFVNSL
jgi:MFS family permease